MGLSAVPRGHLACVVTSLERNVPTLAGTPMPPSASPGGLRLERWSTAGTDRYRRLFRAIGTPWLWFSRLVMSDGALATVIGDRDVHIWSCVDADGTDRGLVELDLRQQGEVELSFFGLVPEAIGRGDGRWLMDQALHLAATTGRRRLWVHSCTLDHPNALAAYQRAGFRPFARAVEVFADPRLIGVLPRSAAPGVPILD